MSSNINWNDVIKKEARGLNDEDFGEVQEVSNGYVFVQKGIINKDKFFIPQEKVESYDGDILRFGISLDEVKSTYQGETYPDSSPNPADSIFQDHRKRRNDYSNNGRKTGCNQKSRGESCHYY